jgi:hypothetical protein
MVSRFTIVALLVLPACVQPNLTGTRGLDGGDAAGLDGPADVPGDLPADLPADIGVEAAAPDMAPAADRPPPPDGPAAECTPRALGCSADGRSTRTCSDQGQWMVNGTCAAQTTCSGGICLCAPEVCDEGAIHQLGRTPGFVGDLAGGGNALTIAINGPQSSIRRFVLPSGPETVVHMGGPELALYALDIDPMGNLLWCSDVHTTTYQTGELVYGTTQLDTGSCTHVRRRDNTVYYRSDALYRKGLDGSPRQMVTREPMDIFELAGDFVYFIGRDGQDSFLERALLSDPTRVDTLARRSDWVLHRLLVDATHAYVMAEDGILRFAQTAGAQMETFWHDAAAQPWAMAQTDSHVYWSTSTISGSNCTQAQVWRKPKQGGPEAVLSTVPGRCAGELVVLGQFLYAIVGGTPGATATDLLRIRL